MNRTTATYIMLSLASSILLHNQCAYGAKPKKYMSNAPAEAAEPAMSGSYFNCPEITSTDAIKIRPDVPMVIAFFGDHCSACKDLQAPLNDFIENNKDVDVISINANNPDVQDIVSIFQIQSVPSMVVLHKHVSAGIAKEFLEQATGKSSGTMMMVTTREEMGSPENNYEEEESITLRQTDIPLNVTPEDIAPVNLPEDLTLSNTKNSKKYGAKGSKNNTKKSARTNKRSSRRS